MIRTLTTAMVAAGILFSGHCASPPHAEAPSPGFSLPEELAARNLPGTPMYAVNDDSTFVLCYVASKPTTERPRQSTRFFVYDLRSGTVVHEDELADGTVGWANGDQVVVRRRPGTISVAEEDQRKLQGYRFDVRLLRILDLE